MKFIIIFLLVITSQIITAQQSENDIPINIVIDEDSIDTEKQGVFKEHNKPLSYNKSSLINEDGGSFTYLLNLPKDGYYHVYAWWPSSDSRSNTATDYEINHSEGWNKISVNQNINNGKWNSLGHYYFKKNTTHKVTLTNSSTGPTVIDALRIEYLNQLLCELLLPNQVCQQ